MTDKLLKDSCEESGSENEVTHDSKSYSSNS